MDAQQHELYEYAQSRMKQKKGLFIHFTLLVLGSVFLFVANKWLSSNPEKTWWTWAVAVWVFLFLLHLIKVYILDSFMNKNWERAQIDKLMVEQSKKVAQLKNTIENTNPSAE